MEPKIDYAAPLSWRAKIANAIFWPLLVAQIVLFENEKIPPPSYWLGKSLGLFPAFFERVGGTVYEWCMHIYLNYINIKHLARAFFALTEPVLKFVAAPAYFFKGLVWDDLSTTGVIAVVICAAVALFMLVVAEYNAPANYKPSRALVHVKFFVDWLYGWASIICVDILQFLRLIGFDVLYETLVALLTPLVDIASAPARSVWNRVKELKDHPKIAAAVVAGGVVFGLLYMYGVPNFTFDVKFFEVCGNHKCSLAERFVLVLATTGLAVILMICSLHSMGIISLPNT